MLFYFLCQDKPDHADVRAAHRPAHLAYLGEFGDRIKLAGPTLDTSGQQATGSLIIVEAADAEAAVQFSQNDPYTIAGLFASVTWGPWRQVIPAS
jgi:uncharacterized protein YciI